MPSGHPCMAGTPTIGTVSELPTPSRSHVISRLKEASRRRPCANVGSSHMRSIGNVAVGT